MNPIHPEDKSKRNPASDSNVDPKTEKVPTLKEALEQERHQGAPNKQEQKGPQAERQMQTPLEQSGRNLRK